MPLLYSNCLDLWSSKERVWSDVLMDINIMRLWVSMIFNQKGIILTKSYVGPQKLFSFCNILLITSICLSPINITTHVSSRCGHIIKDEKKVNFTPNSPKQFHSSFCEISETNDTQHKHKLQRVVDGSKICTTINKNHNVYELYSEPLLSSYSSFNLCNSLI